MSTLVLVHIHVENPGQLAAYTELAGPTMKEHNVRLLGKAVGAQMLEGDPVSAVTVVLEADSVEQVEAWHDSDGYKKAIEARSDLPPFQMVVVPRMA